MRVEFGHLVGYFVDVINFCHIDSRSYRLRLRVSFVMYGAGVILLPFEVLTMPCRLFILIVF